MFTNINKKLIGLMLVFILSLTVASQIHKLATKAATEDKITASDAAADDYFGSSVSISGNYAVVGAYQDDDDGDSSGSAYIFEYSGGNWSQVAKLKASDAAAGDEFGYSVAISNDYALVGAHRDNNSAINSGSAYIFEKPVTGWVNATETAKLTASDSIINDCLGGSASIDGDYAVVGAHGKDNGDASGSVYIFEKPVTGWVDATETAKLTASDGAAYDYFGTPVSINGDYIIAGASKDDDGGDSSGSAYIFEKPVTGWVDATETAKLTASDAAANDSFGNSVSINGDYIAIGACGDSSGSGSAYIFEKPVTGWVDATETAKLTASDGAANDNFGISVSIFGNYAIIGANLDDDAGTSSGSAYFFKRIGSNWNELTKFIASDGSAYDYFGKNISISGDYVIIGAYGNDDNGNMSGSAYILDYTNIDSDFTDANFRSCVLTEIQNSVNPGATYIDIDDAAALGSLNCGYQSISSIAGGEYLTGLNSLTLDGNPFTDISPISGSTNLTYLRFNNCNVNDISSLNGLINLMTFRFPVNSINDISVLSNMTNLSTLNANSNGISDISSLTGLTGLTNVELFGNNISNISSLSGLTSLTILNLGVNIISDLNPLANLISLTSLEIQNNSISDLSPLYSGPACPGCLADFNSIDISNNSNLNLPANLPQALDDVDTLTGDGATITHTLDENIYSKFTDSNFGDCVESAIGHGTPGVIDPRDAAALVTLNCNSQSISSIAGAEHLTGVTNLDLNTNNISDLTPLSGLTSLTDLWLGLNNNISDINPLSGLTNLTYLYLDTNSISDINPISGLTNLTDLYLGNNNITNISILSGLTNLDHLSLYGNSINDISSVSGLTNLIFLDLGSNNINDISSVSGLINLTYLGLSINNNISDINPVSGLTNLTTLDLGWNNISDISPVSGLTNLTILSVRYNNITDISSVSGLTNLTDLYLNGNNIVNISPLNGLINLTDIDLRNNSFTDLSPLNDGTNGPGSGCDPTIPGTCTCINCFADNNDINISNNTGLNGANAPASLDQVAIIEDTPSATITHNISDDITSEFTDANFLNCVSTALGTPGSVSYADAIALSPVLSCMSRSISSIAGAEYLTGLSEFRAEDNNISDLTPLGGLTNLQILYLWGNNISDLIPLGGLTNLQTLYLWTNNISDLTSLSGLTNLQALSLWDNNISDLTPLGGLTSLIVLHLAENNINDISSLNSLTTLQDLFLNNNNIINISSLSALINLTTLDLTINSISDLSPIGSANATLTGFRDNNVINISDNNFTGVGETALTEIHDYLEGTPNPAIVTHNIDWENCTDGIDNDDDGDIDGADSYCFVPQTTFYIDYEDTNGYTACTLSEPCDSIQNMWNACAAFITAIADTDPVTVNVQGTSAGGDTIGNFATITAPSVTFQPWNSTPIVEGLLRIRVNNIVIDGFEIRNNITSPGIQVFGNDAVIRNNYVHNMGMGIVLYGGAVAGFDAENAQVYNNILSNNEDIPSGYCGGILAGGSIDAVIINNTLYNNCSTFAFDGTTNFLAGDIALFAAPGMGITAPVNTLVKQNLVYNDLGGTGNTYYYDVGGELINSVAAVGVITNQTAADHGINPGDLPSNFSETITDPYVSAATVTDYASAGTGFGLTAALYATYQIGSPDAQTPTTDFLSNTRPTGIGEAGAIEYLDTVGGGSAPAPGPVCDVFPTKLQLSNNLPVSQIGGEPVVRLNWGKAFAEIDAIRKVNIFLDYLNRSTTIGAEEKNIKLKNVFTCYMRSEFSEDVTLNGIFDEKLEEISDEPIEDNVCNDRSSVVTMRVIDAMKRRGDIKGNINNLIADFADGLIDLENTLREADSDVETPYTDFYSSHFNDIKTSGEIEIYRDDELLYTETHTDNNSYTDKNIPVNNTGRTKYYNYHLISKTECGSEQSNTGKARIDPTIENGTIDVTLDLKITTIKANNYLLMKKLRELFGINGIVELPEYNDRCDEVIEEFIDDKTGERAFEYLIECFSEGDESIMKKLTEKRFNIIPPLMIMLKLGSDDQDLVIEDLVNEFMESVLQAILNQIEIENEAYDVADGLSVSVGSFIDKYEIADLSEIEKELIKEKIFEKIDSKYFEENSHSANIIVEKYDEEGEMVDFYKEKTDEFGETEIFIGGLSAGKEYTIKIKLYGKKYTLPKIAVLNINSGIPTGETNHYTTDVALSFIRPFKYGDFNEDEKIDLYDIKAWGEILNTQPEKWEQVNINGLPGIDLLDAVTLQEHWGSAELKDIEENQITLMELLELFGLITTDQSTAVVPGWVDWIKGTCSI